MRLEPKILARPGAPAGGNAPRRGDLTCAERERLAWLLGDYAEMLLSCALGIDDDGPIDRETRQRAEDAQGFAVRIRAGARA